MITEGPGDKILAQKRAAQANRKVQASLIGVGIAICVAGAVWRIEMGNIEREDRAVERICRDEQNVIDPTTGEWTVLSHDECVERVRRLVHGAQGRP